MQKNDASGKLVVVDGWVVCPVCRRNRRLLHVYPETRADRLPVFCRDCKSEIILHIEGDQSVERRSP